MNRWQSFVVFVCFVALASCVPGGSDRNGDAGTITLPDGNVLPGDTCSVANAMEVCPVACWTIGLRSCLRYPDGMLHWTPCTPAETYGARYTCDAGTPPPVDSGVTPPTDAGPDFPGGSSCPVDNQVRSCVGSAMCTPIVQWCDAASHQWTSCTLLPQPDSCRPDSGQPDAGTPDAGSPDVGTPDAGQPDVGTLDVGFPDVGSPDVGTPDVGFPDVGTPDVGTPDVGTPDTGVCTDGTSRACTTRCSNIGLQFCVSGYWSSCIPLVMESCGMDASVTDTGSPDVGSPDVGSPDVGSDIVVPTDMGSDTGSDVQNDTASADVGTDVVADASADATPVSDVVVTDVSDVLVDTTPPPCCSGIGCGTIILCTTHCGMLGFMTIGEACVGGTCHPISPSSETCDTPPDAGADVTSADVTPSTDGAAEASADATSADATPSGDAVADTSDATADATAEASVDAASEAAVEAGTDSATSDATPSGDATADATPSGDGGAEAGADATPTDSTPSGDAATADTTVTEAAVEAGADVSSSDATPPGDAAATETGADVATADATTDASADVAADSASADASADAQTILPDVPGDAGDFSTIAYVVSDPPVMDPTCGGATLTTWPAACVPASGVECLHICHVANAWITSTDPSRSFQNSTSPNAFIRPTSMRFTQPELDRELGTVTAPSGRGVWEGSVYATYTLTDGAILNEQDVLPRQAYGPDSTIWTVGNIALQQGLSRNGSTRVYRVNADLTQTLRPWEQAAREPTYSGTVAAFRDGGNMHLIGYLCPAYLAAARPTGGSYRCDNVVTDEPVYAGVPILN